MRRSVKSNTREFCAMGNGDGVIVMGDVFLLSRFIGFILSVLQCSSCVLNSAQRQEKRYVQ